MNNQNLKIHSYCKYLALTLAFALTSSYVFGQTHRETVNVQLPTTLDFVTIDSKATAFYELYVTNFSIDTLHLKKLTVSDSADSTIYLTSQNQELQNRYSRIGSSKKDTTIWLPPGHSAVMYVELSLPRKPINEITHLLTFEVVGKENLGELKIQTATTKCFISAALILGNPLPAGAWTAVYDPSWERGHRKVIYTLHGKARIPGRYAIDFIKIDEAGNYAKGNDNIIRNWFGYEVDVLAVAEGVVSSIKDDFPESQTISEHPNYTSDKATGNYISLELGKNVFAFYEHLKPKSIKVKIGQRVKKGEVIASLGFTGQTTGPHLHFHVADADSPLGAEGIPFVFDTFITLGFYPTLEGFGKSRWTPLNDSKQLIIKQERPSPNSVIRFGFD